MKTSTVRNWAAIGLVTTLLTLAGCAKSNAAGSGGLAGSAPTTAPTVPSATSSIAPTTTATSTSTQTATSTTTKASGPTIDSFTIVQKPSCPIDNGTAAPYSGSGQDIILKWKVTGGVTKVALSLDDSGYFKQFKQGTLGDYPTSGTADLPFECNPTVQPNTTHKYYLDTIGGGPSQRRVLTVTEQTSP